MDELTLRLVAVLEETVARATEEQTGYRAPLLGVVAAADPGWKQIREQGVADHLWPADLLPGAAAVVAFFLPFTEDVVRDNRAPENVAASWAVAYVETNALIARICRDMAEVLETAGYAAAWETATRNFDKQRLVSRWSHRSVAYLAGLGEWGANRMLITPAGCAGRFGSLATDAPLRPTKRLLDGPACLEFAGRACGACRRRCPVGALQDGELDRQACYRRLLQVAEEHRDVGFADACGKCLQGPCALGAPAVGTKPGGQPAPAGHPEPGP